MRILGLVVILAGLPGGLCAQTATDSSAIRQAALDYIEGWYEGNADRMERAVHPELAKRIVRFQNGELVHTGAGALVESTGRGDGTRTPPGERRTEVSILDIYENTASVRVTAHEWVDYMHLGRVRGEWKIINVLWELSPEAKVRRSRIRRPSGGS